ncbi:MAG: sodium-dependent transporter, partial [Oscillospiraceae bacterium]
LNKIIMPLLIIIFVMITVKSLSLPGSIEGVKYLVQPRWEHLKSIETWIMALGQAYFTVSLTGCGLVVYGSYSDDSYNIPKSAILTAICDTVAALFAAFMIIPAVFALNLDLTAGPALLFITVPKIFQSIPFGSFLSSLFFLSIIFAAISSSVNMLEGPVEAIMSVTKFSRSKIAYCLGLISFLLAIPLAINIGIFEAFTNFMTIIVAPIGVLIVAYCFYYYLSKEKILEEVNKSAKHKLGNRFIFMGKYVFIITTIVVIILGIKYGGIG